MLALNQKVRFASFPRYGGHFGENREKEGVTGKFAGKNQQVRTYLSP